MEQLLEQLIVVEVVMKFSLMYAKLCYHDYKGMLLAPVLSQMNSFDTFIPNLFEVYFNFVLTSVFSKWSLPFRSSE
jgi:hypothetical protein